MPLWRLRLKSCHLNRKESNHSHHISAKMGEFPFDFPMNLPAVAKTRFRLLAPHAFIILTFSCSDVGAAVLSHRFIGIPENTLVLVAPGFESCRLLSHSTPAI